MLCLFASDLHGAAERYEKLWRAVEERVPGVLFLGGDLLPHAGSGRFVGDFLALGFERLRDRLGDRYPEVFLILGNDDGQGPEAEFREIETSGLWTYAHGRGLGLAGHRVFGYAYVPPTPFLLKDWERYDVSRYVPVGCVSPEEGRRTFAQPRNRIRYATIQRDLEDLADGGPLDDAIFLFHSPPHETALDRAANDGKMVDHAPMDLHVGSIAIRRFIEQRQPLLTMHGHIHESARLTGGWRDRIGRTWMFGGSHDGPELALVQFRLDDLEAASRDLL